MIFRVWIGMRKTGMRQRWILVLAGLINILVSVTGWGTVYVDVETTGGTFMIEMDVGVRHGEATDGYFDAVVPFGHLLEMEQGRE